jgi:hypothetical protein
MIGISFGIVGKIRIHLEDEIELTFDGVFESGDIGRSQAHLPFPLKDMDPVVGFHHLL